MVWLIVWAERRSWLPFGLPAPEATLSIAATSLSVGAAVAIRWLEDSHDALARTRRLLAVGVAALLMVGVSLTGFRSALDGDWGLPTEGYEDLTEQLGSRGDSASRILWVGEPSVLPVGRVRTSTGINFAITDGGRPGVRGRWSPKPVGSEAGVASQIDLAASGDVANLGRLLAPYGIDVIVVVDQLAPVPYQGPKVDPGGNARTVFSRQLDLKRLGGYGELSVFDNTASSGIAVALSSADAISSRTPSQQLGVDLGGSPVEATNTRPGHWVVDVPADVPVLVAIPNSNLDVSGARDEVLSGFDDMTIIPAGEAGTVELSYGTSWRRRLALLAQTLLVGFGIVLAQTRKEEVGL